MNDSNPSSQPTGDQEPPSAEIKGAPELVWCSFCGKNQGEVAQIIVGPVDHAICDECIMLCMTLLMERYKAKTRPPAKLSER